MPRQLRKLSFIVLIITWLAALLAIQAGSPDKSRIMAGRLLAISIRPPGSPKAAASTLSTSFVTIQHILP
jgi:hypothetical protein